MGFRILYRDRKDRKKDSVWCYYPSCVAFDSLTEKERQIKGRDANLFLIHDAYDHVTRRQTRETKL